MFRYNAEKQFDSSTETSCMSDGHHGLAVDSGSLLKKEQNRKLQLSVLQARGKHALLMYPIFLGFCICLN